MTKSERIPKTEIRIASRANIVRWQAGCVLVFGDSDFELLSDFGFRISDF